MDWYYFSLLLVITICHTTSLPTFRLSKESFKRESKATDQGIHQTDLAFSDDVGETSHFLDSGISDRFEKKIHFVKADRSGWSGYKEGKAKKARKSFGWSNRADTAQISSTGWSPLFGKKIQAVISAGRNDVKNKAKAGNPPKEESYEQESDLNEVREESPAPQVKHDSYRTVNLPHHETANPYGSNEHNSEQASLFTPNIDAENTNHRGSADHVGYSHANTGAEEWIHHPIYEYDTTYLSNAELGYFQNQFAQNEQDDQHKESGSKGTTPGWFVLPQENFGHDDDTLGSEALQKVNAGQTAVLTDNVVDGPIRSAEAGRDLEYYRAPAYENGQNTHQEGSVSGKRGNFLDDNDYQQQPFPEFVNVAFTTYHEGNGDQWNKKPQSVLIPQGPVVESVQAIPPTLLAQHGQFSHGDPAALESHTAQEREQNADAAQNGHVVPDAVVAEDVKRSEGAQERQMSEEAQVTEGTQASAGEPTSGEAQPPAEPQVSNEAEVTEEAQVSDDGQVLEKVPVTEEAKSSEAPVSQKTQDPSEVQTTILAEIDLVTETTQGYSDCNSGGVVSVNQEATSEVVQGGVTDDSADKESTSVTEGNENPESNTEYSITDGESEKYTTAAVDFAYKDSEDIEMSTDAATVSTEGKLDSSTPEEGRNDVNTDEGSTNTNRGAEAYTDSGKEDISFITHNGPGKYHFRYEVNDEITGDIKHHEEEREGDFTKGTYRLHDPDGTIRTVDYHVKGLSGFQAMVNREGIAMHPQTKRGLHRSHWVSFPQMYRH